MSATVLIIDDQPVNLKLASRVLEFDGYRVLQAADAEEALAILAQARPHLILMDLALPGMDGLTLTRKLKAEPATQSIPIVAMTAFAMKGDEEKAVAAGCDGYLTKPIDTRKLAGQVAGWVKLAGLKATPRP
jgi:CheY-like chemotaxis protein